MLSSSKTYSVLPASDLARATAWFRDKLELEPEDTSEQGVRYRTGGDSWIYIYETSNAGTAQNTAMCWLVDDIVAEMDHLRGRGGAVRGLRLPGPEDRERRGDGRHRHVGLVPGQRGQLPLPDPAEQAYVAGPDVTPRQSRQTARRYCGGQ